jgi:hypothetical protein
MHCFCFETLLTLFILGAKKKRRIGIGRKLRYRTTVKSFSKVEQPQPAKIKFPHNEGGNP